ncbi:MULTISPECIES: class I adenylate-forming enzyme family protein [unclassified Burkholderia]|uniref:class I adenylate-forming enzyme family protein n=1 Tax=unclassified Burkholderia TaxID=2613784 RepID=UPI002AB104C2|nr:MULTISPECIES: AMP-binding protein [unclassified Burkholderia]
MASEKDLYHGVPREGAFDQSPNHDRWGQPLGTHSVGRWRVDESVNVVCALDGNEGEYRTYTVRPASYDAMFRDAVDRNISAEAVVCGERRVTYSELNTLIEVTARGMVEAGLVRGDRVAVMLDNRLEYLVAMLACVRAGGIAIPLGTRLGTAEVEYIVSDAAPVFAITATEWYKKFPCRSSLRATWLVDGIAGDARSFDELQNSNGEPPLPKLNSNDVMMIVYTSGTTGKPKGACLTHGNFIHTCLHYLYALAIDRPQRSILTVPATHIAGFGPLVSVTLASGGTIVMVREFKVKRILELIERERITYAVLVPSMYQLIAMNEATHEYDLSSWKYGVYGGAIMPPATIERFSSIAPTLRMINAYGATETCAVCTIMAPELTATAPASVGLALECTEIRVVDEHGETVPVGESGEFWIRGPNVSPGYWNNSEATKSAFLNGFWKSGDVGSRNSDGLLYVHDRIKDMINRGGFKVFSAEVENAIMGHSEVEECAVVGTPDEVLGERVFAFVKLKIDSKLGGSEQIKEFLHERIADYKIPDFWQIEHVNLPRNQNGKLLKKELRDKAIDRLTQISGGRA